MGRFGDSAPAPPIVVQHLGVCRPCAALLAFACDRLDFGVLHAWGAQLLAAHVETILERRRLFSARQEEVRGGARRCLGALDTISPCRRANGVHGGGVRHGPREEQCDGAARILDLSSGSSTTGAAWRIAMRPDTVTLPRDLFEELCDECEFHAAQRPASTLGAYRAVAAEAARAVVAAGGYVEVSEDRLGRERRRVVHLRQGRLKSGAVCVSIG